MFFVYKMMVIEDNSQVRPTDQDFTSFTLLAMPDDFLLRVRGHQLEMNVQEAALFHKALNCQEDVERPIAIEYPGSLLVLVAGCTKPRLDKMKL